MQCHTHVTQGSHTLVSWHKGSGQPERTSEKQEHLCALGLGTMKEVNGRSPHLKCTLSSAEAPQALY